MNYGLKFGHIFHFTLKPLLHDQLPSNFIAIVGVRKIYKSLVKQYKISPNIHPTFDFMFDDVQCWGNQTIKHFTEHLTTIEMLDEMLACF